jgi:hypothetical protein
MAPKESKDKLTQGLNSLDDEGWELVAVELQPGPAATGAGRGGGGMTGWTIYVFKRSK